MAPVVITPYAQRRRHIIRNQQKSSPLLYLLALGIAIVFIFQLGILNKVVALRGMCSAVVSQATGY